MRHSKAVVSCAALGFFAAPTFAQSIIDVSTLRSIEDIEVHDAENNEIGEVEEVLVDQAGTPVAVVVELGGVLSAGDEDVVVSLEQVTYENDVYRTTLTESDIEALPRFDD